MTEQPQNTTGSISAQENPQHSAQGDKRAAQFRRLRQLKNAEEATWHCVIGHRRRLIFTALFYANLARHTALFASEPIVRLKAKGRALEHLEGARKTRTTTVSAADGMILRCPCTAPLTPADLDRNSRDYSQNVVCSECNTVLCEDAHANEQAEMEVQS